MNRTSAATRARRPVLLVDDPSWDRAGMAGALLRTDILPLTQPGAERALSLAATATRFDAVVVPAAVRDMPVDELIRRLRARRPRVPVLVLGTGADLPAPVSPVEGPVVCVEGTSDLGKLCEALRTWLGVPTPNPEASFKPDPARRPACP